jgi:hypothetical protein
MQPESKFQLHLSLPLHLASSSTGEEVLACLILVLFCFKVKHCLHYVKIRDLEKEA